MKLWWVRTRLARALLRLAHMIDREIANDVEKGEDAIFLCEKAYYTDFSKPEAIKTLRDDIYSAIYRR